MKVLIIEDNLEVVEAVSLIFQIRWPEAKVVYANMGEVGLKMVETEKPEIVILDLGLPDTDGLNVLKDVRLFSRVPVLVLTARADESDIVKALDAGADDYLRKPFRQMELLSRVQALTRRYEASVRGGALVYGTFLFKPESGEIQWGNKRINLTRTESQILYNLMKSAGQVVTTSSLVEAIKDGNADPVNSLRVHIRRLREKLESNPDDPRLILTRSGVGYQMIKPG
jgi:two-component system, OmpR family, response regulator VicR